MCSSQRPLNGADSGPILDDRPCFECSHPIYSHSDEWGCCAEVEYERPAGGIMEYATCGCLTPTVVVAVELQFSIEHRDEINSLVDILGCTRFQASKILFEANSKEGYYFS